MISYKHKFYITLIIAIIILPTFSIAEDSLYVWSNSSNSVQTNLQITSDTTNSLNLESGSAILIEQNSRSSII